jgi:hypothetical protein
VCVLHARLLATTAVQVWTTQWQLVCWGWAAAACVGVLTYCGRLSSRGCWGSSVWGGVFTYGWFRCWFWGGSIARCTCDSFWRGGWGGSHQLLLLLRPAACALCAPCPCGTHPCAVLAPFTPALPRHTPPPFRPLPLYVFGACVAAVPTTRVAAWSGGHPICSWITTGLSASKHTWCPGCCV